MLVDTRQKKYRSSLILERYFLCIYTSIAETPTIEILQFLHYHPLANKVEIMAGLTEAPSDSTADGKKHILFGKRYEFARKRNKMFRDYAERGKSTMGWCFGFKLHLI